MSKSKSLKIQKGQNRPTENRAITAITNQDIDKWVQRIDEAAMTTEVGEKIKAVANVLWELVGKIQTGKVHYLVLFGVIRRRNLSASIALLHKEHGSEWAKGITQRRLTNG